MRPSGSGLLCNIVGLPQRRLLGGVDTPIGGREGRQASQASCGVGNMLPVVVYTGLTVGGPVYR